MPDRPSQLPSPPFSGVAGPKNIRMPQASGDELPELHRPIIDWHQKTNYAADQSVNKAALLKNLGEVLNASGCLALWILKRKPNDQWSNPLTLLGDDETLAETLLPAICDIAQKVRQASSFASIEPPNLTGYILMGAPVVSEESVTDILVALYPSAQPKSMPFEWSFSTVIDVISKWQMTQFAKLSQEQLTSLSSFVNLSAALNRTDNQLDTAITLVNELNAAVQSASTALLLKSPSSGKYKLQAMSGVEFFDRNANTTRIIESTVLGIPEGPVFWSDLVEPSQKSVDESHINLVNYCSAMEVSGCALLPLQNHIGNVFGWLLIGLHSDQCQSETSRQQFVRISKLVAGHLETVLKAQRSLTRTVYENVGHFFRQRFFRKMVGAFSVGLMILCIPFPHNINCDCQIELTRRRFVAAPYEGVLEKTVVESGDIVTKGQTLARMDASQLRMEMSGLQADLERERKKRDAALARRNVAESQIANSEMKRLSSEIAIISKRLAHTEIRSPIAGVIVSGDMDKAEGAPLETGQNLFEVGPLEKMLVEIHIPESDIQYVRPGMPVNFTFNAFPFETFSGTIEKIHPRAEVLDHQTVFVAQVQLQNKNGNLRPGLKGHAKITSDRNPLGWNLFHKGLEKARPFLIW